MKTTSNVLTLAKTPKAKKAAAPKTTSGRKTAALVSAIGMGGISIITTALSLSDLADTVQEIAHCSTWKAWAMAGSLDANFIATESFSMLATAAVVRETRYATTATKVVTLLMSAAANSYSMAHAAEGLAMQIAGVAFGIAIPALLALSTHTLGKAFRG